jgi:hypothetical protein
MDLRVGDVKLRLNGREKRMGGELEGRTVTDGFESGGREVALKWGGNGWVESRNQ